MNSDAIRTVDEANENLVKKQLGSWVNVNDIKIPLTSVLVFLAATLLSAVALELLPGYGRTFCNTTIFSTVPTAAPGIKPTFAVYGKSATEAHLIHVFNVLRRLGYTRTALEDDWDLLWAHDYPFFTMQQRMRNLKAHQVVNHLPGCGFITNKVDLSTTSLPFLPRAFRLPTQREEFLEYAAKNPNALFVEKHNEHRHIVIRSPNDVNLNSSNSFVQEYLQNPLLVDGYKFDIGVYVVITSVDPLRIYIYTGDVLFRYCTVKYHPFDSNNLDKYVVGDDYLPTWEVPSLAKYYNRFLGSMRGSFDAYLRDQSIDPTVIWPQVENIVRLTILAKEKNISDILRSYKTRNFFDLMRFDLLIDEDLRVHLLEANMSPNLSSAHFKPNSLLYEQILYSALNLLGIGSPLEHTAPQSPYDNVKEMVIADRNLATDLNVCHQYNCDKQCNNKACALCLGCITGSEFDVLERSYREHLHRVNMKRIFPKPIHNPENFDIEHEVQNMTEKNKWLTRWFFGKCIYDSTWCT